MKKSKYYYDYTRNMSVEQEMKVKAQNHCGRPTCELEGCMCCMGKKECPNEKCDCPKKKLTVWERIKIAFFEMINMF